MDCSFIKAEVLIWICIGRLVARRLTLKIGPGENNSLTDSKIYWKEEKGVLLRSTGVAVQIYASKFNLIRTVLESVCC